MVEEIEYNLAANCKNPEDIEWIGSKDGKFSVTWDEFMKLPQTAYVPNYTGPACDLVVVGDGWWMELDAVDDEYYVFWSYREVPQRLSKSEQLFSVVSELPQVCVEDINKVHNHYIPQESYASLNPQSLFRESFA